MHVLHTVISLNVLAILTVFFMSPPRKSILRETICCKVNTSFVLHKTPSYLQLSLKTCAIDKAVLTRSIKAYGRMEVYLRLFPTPVLCGGEWLASCRESSTPKDGVPVTHFIRRRVGPTVGLDVWEYKKCFALPGINHDSSDAHLVTTKTPLFL